MSEHLQHNRPHKKQKRTPLQKEQERFNKLVREIAATEASQRQQSEDAAAYHRLYQQQVLPLLRQYAAEKVLLVQQFDAILQEHRFSKTAEKTYTEWAVSTLSEVASFDETAAALLLEKEAALLQLLPARKRKGKDSSDLLPNDEPDAEQIDEDFTSGNFEDYSQGHAAQAPAAAAPHTDDIGPLYKELVKQLHPDLEQDEAEKLRKHELMQQLTAARKAGDLYTMLRIKSGLQPATAQPATNLPLEQLKRYNQLLQQKLQQLQQAFARSLAATMLGLQQDSSSPDHSIRQEVKTLKQTIRSIREERRHIRYREHLEQLIDAVRQRY